MACRLPAMLVAVAGLSSSCLAALPSVANAIADPHREWQTARRLGAAPQATGGRATRVRLLRDDSSFHVAIDLAAFAGN